MSKSLDNTIGLLESPDQIWSRLRPAQTDPARVTRKDPGTPEKCNIYALHQYLSSEAEVDDVAEKCRTAGWGCLDCKRVLADNASKTFAPMRERAQELHTEPDMVRDALAAGAAKAQDVARDTMAGVREHMGYLPSTANPPVA